MQSYTSLIIAVYGAAVSTFTACKWWLESRPYIEIKKAPQVHAGSLFASVHNPGRKPVFIIRHTIPNRHVTDINLQLKVLPYREGGISEPDEIAAMFSRRFWLIAPPGGEVLLTIGPVYEDTDATVIFGWHKGYVAWPKLHDFWQRFINPLTVRINFNIAESINILGFSN